MTSRTLIHLIKTPYKKRMKGKGTLTVCSRGHKFFKSSERPVCPVCWPGRYKKQSVEK